MKVKAQGETDAKVLEAEGRAKEMMIEAQAQHDSYELKKQALNDDILYLEYLDKWNGNFPNVMVGGTDNIMLEIPVSE